jgi:hypothetical protein
MIVQTQLYESYDNSTNLTIARIVSNALRAQIQREWSIGSAGEDLW